MFESILCQVADYDAEIVESLIGLAVEIAREGREGRRIGTLFTLGDETAVMAKSRSLILNPLEGHPESVRHIDDPNLRGTIKELAQLDGAFVVSAAGVAIAACRYLDAAATAIDLPLGLGSRHIAAAHISSATRAVGIVVSESSVVLLPRRSHRRNYSRAVDAETLRLSIRRPAGQGDGGRSRGAYAAAPPRRPGALTAVFRAFNVATGFARTPAELQHQCVAGSLAAYNPTLDVR